MTAEVVKIAVRVLLVTVLFAILGFALGGLIGILSVGVIAATHVSVNAQNALWFGAIPGGMLGSVAGLILITVSEKRTRATKVPSHEGSISR